MSLSGVWPPSCTITPTRLLALDDLEHVLERERLEVQLVRHVEVGRDRFRIRVDHDRLVSLLAQRDHGAHAAVVELDALPDAIRPAAEDHDRLLAAARRLALLVVAAVQVRRRRRELAGAGVDHLVRRPTIHRPATLARAAASVSPRSVAELAIGEAHPLHAPRHRVRRPPASAAYARSASTQLAHLREEPRIDRRELVHLVDRRARARARASPGRCAPASAAAARRAASRSCRRRGGRPSSASPVVQPGRPISSARSALLERFLEGAADRHRLADGLHLRREARARRSGTSRRRSADIFTTT